MKINDSSRFLLFLLSFLRGFNLSFLVDCRWVFQKLHQKLFLILLLQ